MQHIIHQTWKSRVLNEEQTVWSDSIKRLYPDYEYRLWTDEDNQKLIDRYPEFQAFYQTLIPVEKSDFVRYLYIFEEGGIYFDLDVLLKKRLDDVLEGADVYLCDQTKDSNGENMTEVYDPFFLAGEKGHPFFYGACKAIASGIIYRILSSSFDKDDVLRTLYKTGPIMLTKYYLINRHRYNVKILDGVFTPKKFMDERPNAYGVHMGFNSWIVRGSRNVVGTRKS